MARPGIIHVKGGNRFGADNEKETKFTVLSILELNLQKLVLAIAEPW